MNPTTKQALINTLAQNIHNSVKSLLPSGYAVQTCKGWPQTWRGRNGETIEFSVSVSAPKGQANYANTQMVAEIIEEATTQHQVLGAVSGHYDKANDMLAYRCCL